MLGKVNACVFLSVVESCCHIKTCARFVFLAKTNNKGGFRDLAHSCKNAILDIKEHQELTGHQENSKSVAKGCSKKAWPVLSRAGALVPFGTRWEEILSCCFASIFSRDVFRPLSLKRRNHQQWMQMRWGQESPEINSFRPRRVDRLRAKELRELVVVHYTADTFPHLWCTG